MKDVVRIVSNGGTGYGTRVIMPDGTEMPGVLSVKIDEIKPDSPIAATIVVLADVDIEATAQQVADAEEQGCGSPKMRFGEDADTGYHRDITGDIRLVQVATERHR